MHDNYLHRANDMRARGPGSFEDLESRFLNYQRQCDERAKKEINSALASARKVRVSKMNEKKKKKKKKEEERR